mmetsp:Transcript_19890/g.50668  ORF Transcript_19890/g.50668 Transcript_19890/m.50668 type:complete len:124 (-) Transcript_19890:133-504(-)
MRSLWGRLFFCAPFEHAQLGSCPPDVVNQAPGCPRRIPSATLGGLLPKSPPLTTRRSRNRGKSPGLALAGLAEKLRRARVRSLVAERCTRYGLSRYRQTGAQLPSQVLPCLLGIRLQNRGRLG